MVGDGPEGVIGGMFEAGEVRLGIGLGSSEGDVELGAGVGVAAGGAGCGDNGWKRISGWVGLDDREINGYGERMERRSWGDGHAERLQATGEPCGWRGCVDAPGVGGCLVEVGECRPGELGIVFAAGGLPLGIGYLPLARRAVDELGLGSGVVGFGVV